MQVETTEKNEALTTKMQEHANLVQQKDELEQQLLEVRKELDAAYNTIANQVYCQAFLLNGEGISGCILFVLSNLSAQLVPSKSDVR
jgi:hypothetical protein